MKLACSKIARLKLARWLSWIYPLGFLLLLALTLEVMVKRGIISDFIFPPPSEVLASFGNEFGDYWKGLLETLLGAGLGWICALIVGLSFPARVTLSTTAEKTFYPIANFLQTVPLIAIAPLLVIWFGFGLSTVVVSSFIVCVFPIIANTFSGLQSTSQEQRDLFKLYRANAWKTFIHLRLPQAVPQILVGSRMAIGLALIGAIVGEFIASGGLGGIIDASRTQQRMDRVFAAVLTTSFLGILLVVTFDFVSGIIFKRWQVNHEDENERAQK